MFEILYWLLLCYSNKNGRETLIARKKTQNRDECANNDIDKNENNGGPVFQEQIKRWGCFGKSSRKNFLFEPEK